MVCRQFIETEYPLHWYVWNNQYKDLESVLSKKIVSNSISFDSKLI